MLSMDDIVKIVRELHDIGVMYIDVVGGEPLLTPALTFSLLHLCLKHGIRVRLCTSGIDYYTLSKIVMKLMNTVGSRIVKELLEIHVWLSTLSSRRMSSLLNCYGEHILDNKLYSIVKMSSLVKTCVRAVVTGLNYVEVPNIVEVCRRINVSEVMLVRVLPVGRARRNLSLIELKEDDIVRFFNIVKGLVDRYGNYIKLSSSLDWLFLLDEKYLIRSTRCRCGIDNIIILPDGRAVPCIGYVDSNYTLGNVRESKIIDVLNGEERRRFLEHRYSIVRECSRCRFYNICMGKCLKYREHYGYDPICKTLQQDLKKE